MFSRNGAGSYPGVVTHGTSFDFAPGSGTGFVAFIVNGDITISSQVGVAADSSTAVLSGVYITSPTGTFTTSASTDSATERLVGKGIFIAGNFALERDLSEGGGDENDTTAAELFVYDPQLLLTMPEKMKEVPLTWQEVAP